MPGRESEKMVLELEVLGVHSYSKFYFSPIPERSKMSNTSLSHDVTYGIKSSLQCPLPPSSL